MKKILIFSLVMLLGLVTHAQDLTLDSTEFSTYLPAGWSQVDDSASTGTTFHWEQTNYAVVMGDEVNLQGEWLISPSITSTATYNYQITFDYKAEDFSANDNVYLLISPDDGTTWLPTSNYAIDAAWDLNSQFPANSTWYTEAALNIDAFITAGNQFKIAFVYYTENNPSAGDFALDNILVEQDDGGGGGFQNHVAKDFESGIATGGWTTINDNDGTGSTKHWQNHSIARVVGDDTQDQDEWLMSESIIIPDNVLATPYIEIDWFSFTNAGGEGAQLLISNDWGTSWTTLNTDPLTLATANSIITENVDITGYQGDTVMFAFRFLQTADATPEDFYLEKFYVYQTFNEIGTNSANFALGALESVIYPYPDRYDPNTADAAGVAEGFWQVAPYQWMETVTNMGSNWERASTVNGHDYAAHIDSVGADANLMDETLTTETITFAEPSVGADYELHFDWRTETSYNCGDNTDPLLGDVNFADITMEIRTYDGSTWTAWTQLWQEDDETVLEATTVGWVSWDDYTDAINEGDWWEANIDVSSYLTASTTQFQVRFNYVNTTGNEGVGGYFSLDNFYVVETSNPEFEFTATEPFTIDGTNYHIEYTNIPSTQISNPYQIGAYLHNYGIATFDEVNLFATVDIDAGGAETYGYTAVNDADFTSYPSTEYFEIDNISTAFTGGLQVYEGSDYVINYSINNLNGPGNNFSDNVSFSVTADTYSRHDGTNSATVSADGTTGGVGTIFEFTNQNLVEEVSVYFDATATNGDEYTMTIIKLADPNAASGTKVWTSTLETIDDGLWNTITVNKKLTAGFYAFMFNQLNSNDLNIRVDGDGRFVRGNASNIYSNYPDEEGDLWVNITVEENTAPDITSTPANPIILFAGETLNYEVTVEDAEGGAITIDTSNVGPAWLTNWIQFADNGNDTALLSGTPTTDHLGDMSLDITAWDMAGESDNQTVNIKVISQEGLFEPTYIEEFTGSQPANWFTIDDKDQTGSGEHWFYSGNQMMIEGDNNDEQNEWLVSPPIAIPTLEVNSDTTFTMEFDWSVQNFDYFCGGITGILGTGSSGSFNLADVMLVVSTDRGQTWADTLWQEDDVQKVSSSTDGIEGGDDWGYNDGQTYTSVFDVTDAYAGDTIMVAMVYKGKNADNWNNRFYFDNFEINLNEPEVNISVYAEADYDGIPLAQVDYENGESFMAYFVNEGDFVPEGATYTWQIPETEGYGEVNIPGDFFDSSDTVAVEFNYVPEFGYTGEIEFSISLDAENNTSTNVSDNFNTNLNTTSLYPELFVPSSASTDGLSVGLGSIFEVKRTDRLYRIRAYIDGATNAGSDYAISIIKINNEASSTGSVVYTIDDSNGSPLEADPNTYEYTYVYQDQDYDEVILTPGLYVVMYKQLEAGNPIVIGKSNNPFGDFVRGFAGNIYREAEDEGYLNIQMRFYSNNAPDFVSADGSAIQELTVDVIEGFEKVVDLYGMDNDEEALSFGQIVEPAYLDHSWLSVVDNGNDTATMTIDATAVAGEHFAKMYVTDGFDTTELELTINVHAPTTLADEFEETFNGAVTENYPDFTADEHWTLYSGNGRESSNDWNESGNNGRITSDNNNYQDEWLISDNYYIPVTGGDTLYQFSFEWSVDDASKMIGGTYGDIGSGNGFDDFNYADFRVKVSTDNGNTWTLLFQEDNESLIEASTDLNYPWTNGAWYTSEFDMSAYEGQAVKFAFQYEGQEGADVEIDDIMLERVDPYEELDIVNYDVLPRYIPRKQAQNIDVKFSIENTGTATTESATIAAQVLKDGSDLNPAYEETMDIGPLSKGEVVEHQFPMVNADLLPNTSNVSYTFNFDIYQPYTQGETYQSEITANYYSYTDELANNGTITSDPNQGLGQVFYFTESDLLTHVYVYSNETNTLSIDLVKLDSVDATDGELVYSSAPVEKENTNGFYLNIEDVEVDSGYYAVFINDSEIGQSFNISYDTESGDNPGTYIKGTADGFELVEEDRYLNFGLYFDNTAPYFAGSDGSSINLSDEDAYVGVPFTKTVRAKDDDEDDVAGFMGETLPTWVTVTDNGDGFATITGTPTVDDMGENLVVLRAVDGTTFDEDDFIIDVMANPAPSFTTAPITTAYEGKAYSYQAEASDMLGDDVTLTGSGPAWLSITTNGNALTVAGTPTNAEIGQHVVKITATDVNGMTKQQVYTLTVYANADPMFTTSPKLKATAGMEYVYYASAMDEDENQTLTIAEGTNFPAWLTLTTTGNGKATISGTPATTDAGNNSVDIVVNDGLGGTATQSFVIDVIANSLPEFTSTAITAATEDILYEYFITATDADGDYLYFDAVEVANWLTFTVTGNGKATLQGVPTQKDVGSHNIIIHVGDGTNMVAQEFTITVGEVNDAPVFKSTANDVAELGVEYEYLAEAIDEEGMSLIYNSTSLPEWLTIEDQFDGTALIYGVPSESDLGDQEIAIAVTDGENTSEQVFNLSVTNAVGVDGNSVSDVSIYPNPTDGEFTITNVAGADVYVFNTAGKVVKQVESASKIQKIDLSVFNAGSYIVKVITNDKVITKQLNLMK